jgi:hypothetical protein
MSIRRRTAIAVALAAPACVVVAATRAGAEAAEAESAVHTLVQLPVPIAEFAQDGARVAWMTGRCRDPGADRLHRGNDAVAVHTLSSGRTITLTRRACRPNDPRQNDRRGGWSGLVLAGGRVVYWHPVYYGGTGSVQIEARTAAVDDVVVSPLAALGLVVRSGRGGAFAVGADGDGRTLAVGVAVTETTGHECYCRYRLVGGAVRVVSGRTAAELRGAPAPAFLDVAADVIALAPAARTFTTGGVPAPPPGGRPGVVELRNARSGALDRRLRVPAVVLALALSRDSVAVLVANRGRKEIRRYDVRTGEQRAALRVPSSTDVIDVDRRTVVYRAGHDVYVVGSSRRLRLRAAAKPIGLSIEGRRVAWAENVGGRGRIVAATAP